VLSAAGAAKTQEICDFPGTAPVRVCPVTANPGLAMLALEDRHDLADPVDAALGILRLAVPNAPVQTFDFGDDPSSRRHPVRVVGRQTCRCQLRVLQARRDVSGSEIALPQSRLLRTVCASSPRIRLKPQPRYARRGSYGSGYDMRFHPWLRPLVCSMTSIV
jgi:hypothetical protein